MSALKFITSKIGSLLLTVFIASIPAYIFFIVSTIDPQRLDDAYMCMAFTCGLATLLIELGRLFPERISGIFNYLAIIGGFFHGLVIMLGTRDWFYFFHAMCAWGPFLYPIFYILIRKKINEGFDICLCPIIAWFACWLFGLIPAIIGNFFVAFTLPFILNATIVVAGVVMGLMKGFAVLSVAYEETFGKLFDKIAEQFQTTKKGDKEEPDEKPSELQMVADAVKEMHADYWQICRVNPWKSGNCIDMIVGVSKTSSSYPSHYYSESLSLLKQQIKYKVLSLGLHPGEVNFEEIKGLVGD